MPSQVENGLVVLSRKMLLRLFHHEFIGRRDKGEKCKLAE
jgi:hypothetical protein